MLEADLCVIRIWSHDIGDLTTLDVDLKDVCVGFYEERLLWNDIEVDGRFSSSVRQPEVRHHVHCSNVQIPVDHVFVGGRCSC